jgi:hypothetical protein
MTGPPSILVGTQWKRVGATIRLEGETASEECLNLASDAAKLHGLLEGLGSVPRDKATAVFQALGVSQPIQRDNPRAVFSGFVQAALCVPRPDVTAWLLTVPFLGEQPNLLVVHHSDKVVPLSLAGCRLGPSRYLSYNLPGRELIETLLQGE